MKAHLMYRDSDFDVETPLPSDEPSLTQDLELDQVLDAMADDDRFLRAVARAGVLHGLGDPDAIAYRQAILRDALANPAVVRALYDLAVEAIEAERHVFMGLPSDSPNRVLFRSIQVLELFVDVLKRLRRSADEHVADFESDGFVALFDMLRDELSDDYFATVEEHLRTLHFKNGSLMSARLGRGNKGTDYVLRKPRRLSWRERIPLGNRSFLTYQVPDRDEAGAQALSDLRARGISLVANVLAQSTDHILDFFTMLRRELGFYVGCLNLHQRLQTRGLPVCFPTARPVDQRAFDCRDLYDVALALGPAECVVGNDVAADGKALVMITGANQGGKSTFLRSVGLAQLMMQCGMFVGADTLRANVCTGVFTHFRREEDASMTSGKLDEELARMSELVDAMAPNALLLCNESFASTNEREGSEIARQIIRALLEQRVKIAFVTHMYDLAHGAYERHGDGALFLRAEREADGERTFRLREGEPLPTSFGEDLYRRIFGSDPQAAVSA